MKDNNHNKIINQAARSVLKKYGLFQKGQSRTWIDDNGWFLIIIEFQPSNWDKGTYLNVGINYLWAEKDYLSFDYGSREGEFVSYNDNPEEFYNAVVKLAECAMTKVFEYRKFKDINYAKEKILLRNGYASNSFELYNRLMICGLSKDKKAKKFYNYLAYETSFAAQPFEVRYNEELTSEMSKLVNDPEQLSTYIRNKIINQRKFWNSKSSMKKIDINKEITE